MEAVKATRILREGSFPRNRHREKERVEPGVVETFTDVLARRKNETLFRVRDRGELGPDRSPFRRGHASMKHYQVTYETPQPIGEILEVVAPLRQKDWRPPLLDCTDDVVKDEAVARLVLGEGSIDFVDADIA